MNLAKKVLEKNVNEAENTPIVDRVDSLVNALSKEVSKMKKNLDSTNPAIFLKHNTTKKKVYDTILSDMEKEIIKRIKVWKKLIK